MFDGQTTSAGLITQALSIDIVFDDGTKHPTEEFLITTLHPSAKVVLGLPWLRKHNPPINWKDLTLSFNGVAILAATTSERFTLEIETSEPILASTPPHINFVGAQSFIDLMNEGCDAYILRFNPIPDDQESSSESARQASVNKNPERKPRETQNSQPALMTPEERIKFEKVVPKQYHAFDKVFSAHEAKAMPPHRLYDIRIDTINDQYPPIGRVYNMSETELHALKTHIDEMLNKGFIRPSNSPIGAPVLFAKKKDGTLRLCIDYRALNRLTKRNNYPIPLIGNLIDQLRKSTLYTKLDLRAGYHNVRVAEGHEWKTAFRTRYGAFEYLVMPMGLTNAPSVFQQFMNEIFHDMVDISVIVYLDDILIYSENEEHHIRDVSEVLRRLERNDLHLKPEKCEFHTTSVEYLGVIVSPNGIQMDPKKVKIVRDWPAPTNVKEVQSFLGFANFYRRFIDNYSGIVKPLTTLTSKKKAWEWSPQCQSVFELLKCAFTDAPILCHFNPQYPIVIETDSSDYAIASILSQTQLDTQELHPVAFYARSMNPAELNYDIYDKELLAIVESFRQWRAYLEGAKYPIQVYTDHNNLQFFTTTKKLSRRQARWSEFLSGFDFLINYRAGRLGLKPDALTRRPDVYPKKTFRDTANAANNKILIPPEQLVATLAANFILDDDLLVKRIREAPEDGHWDYAREWMAEHPDGPYTFENGLLLRSGIIYVPNYKDIRVDVMKAHHDHKLRGHPGITSTLRMILRTFYWPRIRKDVKSYVLSCQPCLRAKSARRKPYGYLKPLPIAQRPWLSISIDHIGELPESAGYNAILVVICRLTKQAIFIACNTTDTAPDLAQQFIRHVFTKHGLPSDIVSDRGSTFVSKFWQALCKILEVRTNLSTAYHPQTDGQTERTNQTLEQYLRLFVNYDQDDWEQYLPLAEFTYNNTPHSAINMTPFFANKGYHPRLTFSYQGIANHAALEAAEDVEDMQQYLKEQIALANEYSRDYQDAKRSRIPDEFEVGSQVWLDTRNLKTKRPAKKLDLKRTGPYKIIKQISTHAYRLELPPALRGIHNVFHASLLSKHHPDPFPQRKQPPPPPIEIEEGVEEYHVEAILNSKGSGPTLRYHVRWQGYDPDDDTWEPLENLAGAIDTVRKFHSKHPRKHAPTKAQLRSLEESHPGHDNSDSEEPLVPSSSPGPSTLSPTISSPLTPSPQPLRRSSRQRNNTQGQ